VFGPGPKSVSDAVNYEGPREADGIVQWALSKFEQLGGQVKAELVEVTDQKAFASACDKKCVLVFVPSLLESSAKERAQLLEALQAQAKAVRHMPFLWVAAGTQPEWERAYGLTFGFPAVLLLREAEGQKLGFVHRGKLSEIAGFATAPRGLSQAVKGGWPTVLASAKWDGKDAPKVVEEDGFDLDAFLKEA
jgi:protein disulfide-isomerase A6